MDEYTTQRQPEVDIAFINAKARLAITLACGGMLSLIVGLIVLLYGSATPDSASFNIGTLKVTATGIGAVIMATSVMWAYISYKVRPTYSASHRIVHKISKDGSEEYHHALDTTQEIPTDAINKALSERRDNA